jgi:glycosyltransferase involved in cell wall biosynthesis
VARRIAVLIPCYNEAGTIADVVRDYRAALPDAAIHVCDNNSGDDTAELAARAGAQVWVESRQGKGHAVRTLLRSVEADCYVIVDGDGTYPGSRQGRWGDCVTWGSVSRHACVGVRRARTPTGGSVV